MSEVSICNIALAYIGEDSIRSLDELNTRASLCRAMYPIVRDELLTCMDWTFARKTALLKQIDEENYEGAVFSLPSDCLTPLNILPRFQERTKFTVEAGRIVLNDTDSTETFPDDVYLKYTAKVTNTNLFTATFSNLLALDIAVRICMPLTSDEKLLSILENRLLRRRQEVEAEDANRGDEYRYVDEDPDTDTFVNPIG